MSDRNDLLAAERVDYRLTYGREDEPRRCHIAGIDGSDLPNAYWGRGNPEAVETGSGCWDDPEHPVAEEPEAVHIDRWFVTAVREAIHEALEWYWVDGDVYLNPHGSQETAIHEMSEAFAQSLLALRAGESS